MANLFGSLLAGAAEKGGKANLDRLKQESADKRRRSYATLLNEYSQENDRLRAKIAEERDKRQRKFKNEDELNRFEREKGYESEIYTRERNDKLADEKNKRGQTALLYKDLSEIFGEDEAKNIIKGKLAGKKVGGINLNQRLTMLDKLRKEYNNDFEAQGTPESGMMWWRKDEVPPKAFKTWLREKRPEHYSILYGDEPKKPSIVNDLLNMDEDTPESERLDTLRKTVKTNQNNRKENLVERARKYKDVKVPSGSYQQYNEGEQKGTDVMDILRKRIEKLREEGNQ